LTPCVIQFAFLLLILLYSVVKFFPISLLLLGTMLVPSGATLKNVEPRLPTPISESLPGFTNSLQVYHDGVYTSDEVALAMILFYTLWEDWYGDEELKLFHALSELAIIWMPRAWEIKVSVFDEDGLKIDGGRGILLDGLTHGNSVILVSKGSGELWKTSLVHELTHIALMATTGTADPDHLGDKYPGWTEEHSGLIDFVNLLLQTTFQDQRFKTLNAK
jgi:hypothetical protein